MLSIEGWRRQLSASAVVWSGERFETEPGGCVAFSGAGAETNIVYCFGGDSREMLSRRAAEAPKRGTPRVMMISGETLGAVQVLIDDDWVCVGSTPAMRLSADRVDPTAADDQMVRRLDPDDLAAARQLLSQSFGADADRSALLLPDRVTNGTTGDLWGLHENGELRSITVTSDVGDSTSIWSMSTPPSHQGKGHGRRLLGSVLARKRRSGIENVLLFASRAGTPLYRSMGFEVLEYWQQWSRPRWLLGRT
jgi:GNAT superfamily N-acetyltransferase